MQTNLFGYIHLCSAVILICKTCHKIFLIAILNTNLIHHFYISVKEILKQVNMRYNFALTRAKTTNDIPTQSCYNSTTFNINNTNNNNSTTKHIHDQVLNTLSHKWNIFMSYFVIPNKLIKTKQLYFKVQSIDSSNPW